MNVIIRPYLILINIVFVFSALSYTLGQSRLEWSSYHGDIGSDAFRDMTLDNSGNLYAIGTTSSMVGLATNNAFQTTNNGGTDVCLAKFDSEGHLIWATYLGGTLDDVGQAIDIDFQGNIVIVGLTFSDTNLSTNGVHQIINNGGGDAFVAKFTPSGDKIWFSYFGGDNFDFANDVTSDLNGNIIMTGWTQSSTQISSSGAIRSTFSGNEDVYIAKFSTSGQLVWSTYYGDTEAERGLQVDTDDANNIFVAGWVQSANNFTTSNIHQSNYAGGTSDAFVMKMHASGALLWATYYGGDQNEYIDAMRVNHQGEVIVSGSSNSPTGMTTTGAYQAQINGDFDIFLGKFSSSGLQDWGTYYGGSHYENVYGMSLSQTGDIKLLGFTLSDNLSSNGAFQQQRSGNFDLIIPTFSTIGHFLQSTYFGGNLADFGYGIAQDNLGNVYIAGSTNGSLNLATSNGAQTTFGGGDSDGLVAKFSECGRLNVNISTNSPVCQGDTLFLSTNSFSSVAWSGPNGFSSTSNHLSLLQIESSAAGIYSVTVTDQIGCTDTANANVVVRPKPISLASSNSPICEGENIDLQASGGTLYHWSGPAHFTSTLQNPTLQQSTLAMGGSYFVTITNALGCTASTSVQVNINGSIAASVSSNGPVCEGDTIKLTSLGGASFIWNGPNGFSSVLQNPRIVPAKLENNGNYIMIVTDQSGCSASRTIHVEVNPKPIAIIQGDTVICEGEYAILKTPNSGKLLWNTGYTIDSFQVKLVESDFFELEVTNQNCKDTISHFIRVKPLPSVILTPDKYTISRGETVHLNVTGADNYMWSSDSNLSCFNCDDPSASPESTSEFCVEGYLDGCSQDACVTIRVNDDCAVNLPNIFTPNDDGVNDIWCSLGKDCVRNQTLSIYDRWGNLLYTTSGQEVCWQPSVSNPNLQSQVLTFVLHIIFYDNNDQYVSGSITLIK